MGQNNFRQAKKPLFKGFFMYSCIPPTSRKSKIKKIYKQ